MSRVDLNMALYEACNPKDSHIINLNRVAKLLQQGANPNYQHPCTLFPNASRIKDYTFPLLSIISTKENSVDAARLLLDAGADITQVDTCIGNTVLLTAIACDNEDLALFFINVISISDNPTVKKILSQQDQGIECQNTPLVLAIKKYARDDDEEKLLSSLIEAGADVNTVCRNGQTALHWACIERKLLVIKLLCKHGANPAVYNRDGYSPYDYYMYDIKLIDVANPWDENGISKSLTANMREFDDLYHHLGDYKINRSFQIYINNRNKMRNYFMRDTIRVESHAELTLAQRHRLIVDEQYSRIQKAKRRLPSGFMNTGARDMEEEFSYILSECDHEFKVERFKVAPLSLAVKERRKADIDDLIKIPETINALCADGFTALHWAAMCRDEVLIRQLMAHDADPTIKNKYGRTPIDYYVYQIKAADFKETVDAKTYDRLSQCSWLGSGPKEMPEFNEIYVNLPQKELGTHTRYGKMVDITIFHQSEIMQTIQKAPISAGLFSFQSEPFEENVIASFIIENGELNGKVELSSCIDKESGRLMYLKFQVTIGDIDAQDENKITWFFALHDAYNAAGFPHIDNICSIRGEFNGRLRKSEFFDKHRDRLLMQLTPLITNGEFIKSGLESMSAAIVLLQAEVEERKKVCAAFKAAM